MDPSLVQKKRARHRLVGAICLCILAAIVVPMVLESEPKPVERALPMEVTPPAQAGAGDSHGANGASGGTSAAAGASAAASGAGAIASGAITSGPAAAPARPSRTEVIAADVAAAAKSALSPQSPPPQAHASAAHAAQTPALSTVKPVTPPVGGVRADGIRPESARPEARPAPRAESPRPDASKAVTPKPDAPKTMPPKSDAPKAAPTPDVLARLIERSQSSPAAAASAAPPSGSGAARVETRTEPVRTEPSDKVARRFLVQIGAYSNVQSARTVSDRVVQAGLRPYQETVKTAQGDWIRVRVGPFTSRQDAERAQQDLKRAGVTAAIIAL